MFAEAHVQGLTKIEVINYFRQNTNGYSTKIQEQPFDQFSINLQWVQNVFDESFVAWHSMKCHFEGYVLFGGQGIHKIGSSKSVQPK